MSKNVKLVLILIVIIVLGIALYFAYNSLVSPSVTIEDMKHCVSDQDCVPVECGCSCSGCGGFSYDDVVNRKYVATWYKQQRCNQAEICPMECCPKNEIACENNVCVVNER